MKDVKSQKKKKTRFGKHVYSKLMFLYIWKAYAHQTNILVRSHSKEHEEINGSTEWICLIIKIITGCRKSHTVPRYSGSIKKLNK
jgi:hypothetical protein